MYKKYLKVTIFSKHIKHVCKLDVIKIIEYFSKRTIICAIIYSKT